MNWKKARLIIATAPHKQNQIFVSDRDLTRIKAELGDVWTILEIESVVAGDDAKLYKILFYPITHISEAPEYFEKLAENTSYLGE